MKRRSGAVAALRPTHRLASPTAVRVARVTALWSLSSTHWQSPHSGSGLGSDASVCPLQNGFGATPASADEWDSKTEMRDIARQRRYWIVSVVLRVWHVARCSSCSCALSLSPRDDVAMPDRASVLPLSPTLQQDFAEPRTLIGENANEFIDELGLDSTSRIKGEQMSSLSFLAEMWFRMSRPPPPHCH